MTELHLIEYHKTRREYLEAFRARIKPADFTPLQLESFSDPWDPTKYGAKPITNDMVTEVYIEFSERTRKAEAEDYMKTLTGQILFGILKG